MSKPLISFCIPTYNRANVLKESLESYVTQDGFDESIEIVICDNASTDETETVCKQYAEQYPNIKYHRNKENIHDANFAHSLDLGSGGYLKLMNDNLILFPGSLQYIKNCISENNNKQRAVFFSNSRCSGEIVKDTVVCNNFSEYVIRMSYLVTAIFCFGAWNDDWHALKDRTKYRELKLTQDDWTYQLLELKGKSIIYTKRLWTSHDVGVRTGYNWFEVHVENYYKILQPYCDKGLVLPADLKKEKRNYLFGLRDFLVIAYLYNIRPNWQFDMSGTTKVMWRHFYSIPYFYVMIFTFPIWGGGKVVKHFMRVFKNKYLNKF